MTVFDLSQDSSDQSQCYPLKVESSAVVCVYKDVENPGGLTEPLSPWNV